ncbi:hypothetical protein ACXJJ3_32670 [Kribbella sp. WER1]
MNTRDVFLADAATLRLRQEEPPLGLDEKEAICPSCNLAYFVPVSARVICRDCCAELDLL